MLALIWSSQASVETSLCEIVGTQAAIASSVQRRGHGQVIEMLEMWDEAQQSVERIGTMERGRS